MKARLRFPRRSPRFILFACSVFALFAWGPRDALGREPEPVSLQLKWHHQFQFAGYYAAIEKGFYREAGLDVRLIEGEPGMNFSEEVVTGRAQYGVGEPSLLLDRARGKPLVVMAAIFQHSPEVLVVRRDAEVSTPAGLVGRPVSLSSPGVVTVRAMFRQQGISLDRLEIRQPDPLMNDLVEGRVVARACYLTDAPFIFAQKNLAYTLIRPLSYGIDFYGDCLFTTEQEIARHPDRARAMRESSLKGWRYAMAHPEEIVDLITRRYPDRLTRDQLTYEAEAMRSLMVPDFVEIGHMNPDRWRHIADTFIGLGMMKSNRALEGFIYETAGQAGNRWLLRVAQAAGGLALCIAAGAAVLGLFNRRLRQTVRTRTSELHAVNQQLRAVFNNTFQFLGLLEPDGTIVDVNKVALDFIGATLPDVEGKPFWETPWWNHSAGMQEMVKGAIAEAREGKVVRSEAIHLDARGQPHTIAFSIIPIRDEKGNVVLLLPEGEDITDRKRVEEERQRAESTRAKLETRLHQAQKMEAVGRLAGGVAHDFNNMLTVILGNAELMKRIMVASDAALPHLLEIEGAAERSRHITRQLLAFSRQQMTVPRVLDVNKSVAGMKGTLLRLLGEDIRFQFEPEESLWPVRCDTSQIDQIILNLSVNARDAMPAGGTLRVRTANVHLDEAPSGKHLDFRPGDFVLLAVSDDGTGIDEDTLPHIFEPFFTTKKEGHGTGLGLATVYGIVEQNEGTIDLTSRPGHGTTFKVYLPRFMGSANPVVVSKEAEASKGIGTVLLVEDEIGVRHVTASMLRSLGYSVVAAETPGDALEIFRKEPDGFDLVLTDVVMPQMSGTELRSQIRMQKPEVKVLLMSGYPSGLMASGSTEGSPEFIQKPFSIDGLGLKIEEILRESQKRQA